ncbi:MAG: hypothetical protein MUF31_05440 [Akkermansiaceae bacterium]|nr:hypothetical protein [Akkermansiaceae bacterium]
MIRAIASSLLAFCLFAAAADPPPPSAAALSYLESLRKLSSEAPPDPEEITAIHPGVTREKLDEIRRILGSLIASLQSDGTLKVAEEKTDGPLAAVIVCDVPQLDPTCARVHAITLILQEDTWQPAPVPASFENLGIDYSPTPAAAAKRLESWLSDRVPHHRKKLQSEITASTRKRLLAALPDSLPAESLPQPWLDAFLKAAEDRDLAGVMATLGGLEKEAPHGWLENMPRIRKVLDSTPAATPYEDPPDFATWTTIAAAPGPRKTLEWTIEGNTATTRLFELYLPLCRRLNPDEAPPVYFSTYKLEKADYWRVLLDDSGEIPVPPVLEPAGTDDADRFLRALAADHAMPPAHSPAELAAIVTRSLSLDHPGPLLACIASRPEIRPSTWSRLLRLWARTLEVGRPPLVLDIHTNGPAATVAWCVPEAQFPLIPKGQISFLRFVESSGTWSLDPTRPTEAPTRGKALAWGESCQDMSTPEWFRHLGLDTTLAGLPAGDAPPEEEAQKVITAWATAVTADDLAGILQNSVVFDDPKGIERIAGVIAGELPSTRGLEIIGIHRHERWAAATVRYPGNPGDSSDYLLLPIVSTPSGPKVLAEIVLLEPDSRPRKYLNDRIWDRLESRLPGPAVDELRTLLDAHSALAEKHRGEKD